MADKKDQITKEPVTVRLSQDTVRALKHEVVELDCSISDFLENLLKDYFDGKDKKTPTQQKQMPEEISWTEVIKESPALRAALRELERIRAEESDPFYAGPHPYDNLTEKEIIEEMDRQKTPTLAELKERVKSSAEEHRKSDKPKQEEEQKPTTIRRSPVKTTKK